MIPFSSFSILSKKWDKGSKLTRERILKEFNEKCFNMTSHQLEQNLGNGGSLFLTRITACLRLSYMIPSKIDLEKLLRAISIFIRAGTSGGSQFLLEFLETGGILALLDIILHKSIQKQSMIAAISLLTQIAGAGRHFKESVSEKGLDIACKAMSLCTDADLDVIASIKILLIELGRANANNQQYICRKMITMLNSYQAFSSIVVIACLQIFSHFLYESYEIPKHILDVFLSLLKSTHLPLQLESFKLLKKLINIERHQDYVTNSLIENLCLIISEPSEFETEDVKKLLNKMKHIPGIKETFSARKDHRRESIGSEYSKQSWEKDLIQESKSTGYQHVMQVYSAKIFQNHLISKPFRADAFVKNGVHYGLLITICNSGSIESKRVAGELLVFIMDKEPTCHKPIREILGGDLFAVMVQDSNTFYNSWTKTNIAKIRHMATHYVKMIKDDTLAPLQEEQKVEKILEKVKEEPVQIKQEVVKVEPKKIILNESYAPQTAVGGRGVYSTFAEEKREIKEEQTLTQNPKTECIPTMDDYLQSIMDRDQEAEMKMRFPKYF